MRVCPARCRATASSALSSPFRQPPGLLFSSRRLHRRACVSSAVCRPLVLCLRRGPVALCFQSPPAPQTSAPAGRPDCSRDHRVARLTRGCRDAAGFADRPGGLRIRPPCRSSAGVFALGVHPSCSRLLACPIHEGPCSRQVPPRSLVSGRMLSLIRLNIPSKLAELEPTWLDLRDWPSRSKVCRGLGKFDGSWV